ncbi:related to ATP20-subunit G of mitochondrial F1F0-ATP Synthase [Armillaria ostoyae]|uniref:Related to ATP20-subunit G of mitochondrial F1F0-ATP Synthase n=1 Tax=Armillaria ostoyae TaxID=47428 RepID=A0A284R4P3_ARMOS|nr:related to ATP20-subunit G of mitochondrial F1F0-ATP Synthase [Armillaria ostoyae]
MLRARIVQAARHARQYSTKSTQEKAQEAAGKAFEQGKAGAEKIIKALGPLGERAGGLLGAYREPIVYNFAVVRSLAKQVYVAESLAPPKSVAEVKAAYREIWESALKWRQLNYAKVGVYALEAYGIFKVWNF